MIEPMPEPSEPVEDPVATVPTDPGPADARSAAGPWPKVAMVADLLALTVMAGGAVADLASRRAAAPSGLARIGLVAVGVAVIAVLVSLFGHYVGLFDASRSKHLLVRAVAGVLLGASLLLRVIYLEPDIGTPLRAFGPSVLALLVTGWDIWTTDPRRRRS